MGFKKLHKDDKKYRIITYTDVLKQLQYIDYLKSFYHMKEAYTGELKEVFKKFHNESTYPIYDVGYFTAFNNFAMVDLADNLHLINQIDLTKKLWHEFQEDKKTDKHAIHPCFPLASAHNNDSEHDRREYLDECKDILKKIRRGDTNKHEFFVADKVLKRHVKNHKSYLRHIQTIQILTDIKVTKVLNNIPYDEFHSVAKKVCAEAKPDHKSKFDTKRTCLKLSLISLFVDDFSHMNDLSNSVKLNFVQSEEHELLRKSEEYGMFLHDLIKSNKHYTWLFSHMGKKILKFEGDRIKNFKKILRDKAKRNSYMKYTLVTIVLALFAYAIWRFISVQQQEMNYSLPDKSPSKRKTTIRRTEGLGGEDARPLVSSSGGRRRN